MTSLLCAAGTPMIRAGDEILQSNGGNNNLYAQDNETSWIDWEHISSDGKNMLTLVRWLMNFRRNHKAMEHHDFYGEDEFTWYRPDGEPMQTGDWQDYVRALSYFVQQNQTRLFFIFNAFDQPIKWQLL